MGRKGSAFVVLVLLTVLAISAAASGQEWREPGTEDPGPAQLIIEKCVEQSKAVAYTASVTRKVTKLGPEAVSETHPPSDETSTEPKGDAGRGVSEIKFTIEHPSDGAAKHLITQYRDSAGQLFSLIPGEAEKRPPVFLITVSPESVFRGLDLMSIRSLKADATMSEVELTLPLQQEYAGHVLRGIAVIDTERNLLLEMRSFYDEIPLLETSFEYQAAEHSTWVPQRVSIRDKINSMEFEDTFTEVKLLQEGGEK